MAADLTITVANEPGSLAEMAQHLADAGVNISSITCDAGGVEAVLHVLVEDPEAARDALEGTQAVIMSEQEVVVVQASDEPGVLADLAAKVAEADVNIDLVYVATGTRVVFGSTDLDALRSALE